ncbi:MAG: DnaA/Hda family protein [Rhodospirillales bacterium]
MPDRQLILDLGQPPSWRADDFLICAANRAAVLWLDRWPAWPAPALILRGPPGCGKTHLAQAFVRRTGSRLVTATDLAGADGCGADPDALVGASPGCVVEDADRGLDRSQEEGLFHLYNALAASRRTLLLTAQRSVGRWPLALADIRSRLLAAPDVAIDGPDETLIAALLVKLFADRQLAVDDDVIIWLLPRLERSFAAIEALVDRLDRAALAHHRRITIPFARTVLDASGETAA